MWTARSKCTPWSTLNIGYALSISSWTATGVVHPFLATVALTARAHQGSVSSLGEQRVRGCTQYSPMTADGQHQPAMSQGGMHGTLLYFQSCRRDDEDLNRVVISVQQRGRLVGRGSRLPSALVTEQPLTLQRPGLLSADDIPVRQRPPSCACLHARRPQTGMAVRKGTGTQS